jgi:hypothetical protein
MVLNVEPDRRRRLGCTIDDEPAELREQDTRLTPVQLKWGYEPVHTT